MLRNVVIVPCVMLNFLLGVHVASSFTRTGGEVCWYRWVRDYRWQR